MERGDDTDSTSDFCHIRSDKSSDAGDNPDDTLSANEEGSYVPQRLGCLLEEHLAGGRGRAPRFAQRTCVTVSASGGARLSARPVWCRQHGQEHLYLGSREG
jgi:hypothetical protein